MMQKMIIVNHTGIDIKNKQYENILTFKLL